VVGKSCLNSSCNILNFLKYILYLFDCFEKVKLTTYVSIFEILQNILLIKVIFVNISTYNIEHGSHSHIELRIFSFTSFFPFWFDKIFPIFEKTFNKLHSQLSKSFIRFNSRLNCLSKLFWLLFFVIFLFILPLFIVYLFIIFLNIHRKIFAKRKTNRRSQHHFLSLLKIKKSPRIWFVFAELLNKFARLRRSIAYCGIEWLQPR
jgi:hypothetical protein